ncbi:MAG: branched-chain amino acid ABC transporter permease [Comamonadaceae bacterium]|nr:branched-chain amino acid ABC transporter permease [Comamonadaceae bacterium]
MGAAIQRGLLNRILTAPHEMQILLMLGVALVMENGALMLFGPDPAARQHDLRPRHVLGGPHRLRPAARGDLRAWRSWSAFLLYVFLRRTDTGRMIRAASDNQTGALLVGTDIRKVFALAFGMGAACVGVAGGLMTPFFPFTPSSGLFFTVTSFNIVVIGGHGELAGGGRGRTPGRGERVARARSSWCPR